MKVCTDACILGAYAPVERSSRVLDIGTGTGLLALMVAQRSQARIDAVELNAAAFEQATRNVRSSPFAERVTVIHQAIQAFGLEKSPGYDVILSNPPFFWNHLLSPQSDRNTALHAGSLSPEDLLKSVERLLAPAGNFVVLLPVFEGERLVEQAAGLGWFPVRKLSIRHSANHPFFRVIFTLSRENAPYHAEELTIYDNGSQYTEAFRALLQEYYLIF